MKTYEIKNYGKTYNVHVELTKYVDNDTLAICLIAKNEEPFCTLTVNIGESNIWANESSAFVDTNNCPWAEEFIQKNGLGMPIGYMGHSGFCSYPLYHFNLDKLKE